MPVSQDAHLPTLGPFFAHPHRGRARQRLRGRHQPNLLSSVTNPLWLTLHDGHAGGEEVLGDANAEALLPAAHDERTLLLFDIEVHVADLLADVSDAEQVRCPIVDCGPSQRALRGVVRSPARAVRGARMRWWVSTTSTSLLEQVVPKRMAKWLVSWGNAARSRCWCPFRRGLGCSDAARARRTHGLFDGRLVDRCRTFI